MRAKSGWLPVAGGLIALAVFAAFDAREAESAQRRNLGPVLRPYERPGSDAREARRAAANILPRGVEEQAAGANAPPQAPDPQRPSLVWQQRYRNGKGGDSLGAMVLGPDRSVYVTGGSSDLATGDDVITMKFGPDGRPAWRRRYHREAGSRERGNALAIDSLGNVYVAAEVYRSPEFLRFLLLKYSAQGRLEWTHSIDSRSLGGAGNAMALHVAVDRFDDVYFCGRAGSLAELGSGYDIVTMKLAPDGTERWRRRYAGLPVGVFGDQPVDMRVDLEGNVVVAGSTPSSLGDLDWVVLKYGPEGEELWQRRNFGLEGKTDEPRAMALGPLGDIYVAGYRTGSKDDRDFLVVKFSPSGSLVWKKRHLGRGKGRDEARAISVDAAGDIYVGGMTYSGVWTVGKSEWDFVTIKYNPQGRALWQGVWRGTPFWSDDYIEAVQATGDGGVVVAGYGRIDSTGLGDYVVGRYSASGELQWIVTYDGLGENSDLPQEVALDDQGGIYVSGVSWGGRDFDILTLKFQEP